jgi:hypothetical protein
MDVICNVALGSSLIEKKIAVLEGIAAKQELLISTLGPTNPIASLGQYSYTLRKAVELSGFPDSSQFFTQLPANYQPPAPTQPPPPSPAEVQANAQVQVEQIRSSSQQAIKGHELQLKALQVNLEHQRETAKNATQATLQRYDIELKHHATITAANMNHDVAQTKAALDHHLAATDMQHSHGVAENAQDQSALKLASDMTLAHGKAGAEHALAVEKLSHDQEMAQRQQAAAEQAGPAGE